MRRNATFFDRSIRTIGSIAALTCAVWGAAGASGAGEADSAADLPRETVERFVAAFDRHDLEALIALAHPEIEWLSVGGSEISVETRGAEALETSLSSYFRSCPTCRATVAISSVNGPYVAAIETATWEAGGANRSQSSLSVYEIAEGRVRRVWYYPAVKPEPSERE